MLDERFWSKVDTTGDCWDWTASVIGGPRGGYGQFRVGRKMRKAHVVSYEAHVGPVPPGLQLDHLCRNRRCVNPAHLEPVTARQNHHRSPLTPASRMQCPRGHSLSDAYLRPRDGARVCTKCQRLNAHQYARTERYRAYQRNWKRAQRAARAQTTVEV